MKEIDISAEFKVGDSVLFGDEICIVKRIWLKYEVNYDKTKLFLDRCYTIKPSSRQRIKVPESQLKKVTYDENGIPF